MHARIAHDLNNQLVVIRGYAEMLRRDSEPGSPTRKHSDLIIGASTEALRLASELLGDSVPSRRETVLVVEEDAAVRELAHEVLEREGYIVLQAADGTTAEAIAHAYREPIDLLLADPALHRVDVRALAARLQRTSPGLRVLLMSGYEESLGLHPEGFVKKPFTIGRLTSAVRRLLDES